MKIDKPLRTIDFLSITEKKNKYDSNGSPNIMVLIAYSHNMIL